MHKIKRGIQSGCKYVVGKRSNISYNKGIVNCGLGENVYEYISCSRYAEFGRAYLPGKSETSPAEISSYR